MEEISIFRKDTPHKSRPNSIWPVMRLALAGAFLLLSFSFSEVALGQEEEAEVASETTPRELSAEEFKINSVLQEMFWRARANDNSVFYEYEFSYLRKEMTLDKYLTGIRFRRIPKPNSDSIMVLTLDSALIVSDTARAFVTMSIGDGIDIPTRYLQRMQYLIRENGRWIKPLSTNALDNDAFYRRMDDYERDAEEESGE